MTGLGAVLDRYGSIAVGLLLGTICKLGWSASTGGKITIRGLMIDLSFQGVLGLVALIATDLAGVQGDRRVYVGAIVALNSDRVLRRVMSLSIDNAVPPAPGA